MSETKQQMEERFIGIVNELENKLEDVENKVLEKEDEAKEWEINFKELEKSYEEQVGINEGLKVELEMIKTPELTTREKMFFNAQLAKKKSKTAYEVGRIKKNGTNTHFNYQYVTESDLTDEMRKILFDNGLSITPDVMKWEKDSVKLEITRVYMKITLTDVDTGYFEETTWIGEGQDRNDKGFYKAYTGILKYYLMKTFLVPSGDDPENDNELEKDNGGNQSKPKASEKQLKLIHNLIGELASFGGENQAIIDTLKVKLKELGEFDVVDEMDIEMASKSIQYLKGWIENKKKKQKEEEKRNQQLGNAQDLQNDVDNTLPQA